MRRFALLCSFTLALVLVSVACGGGEDDALLPVSANSELVVGPNRFALGLIDSENQPVLGSEDSSVGLRFFFEDELKAEHDAMFVWAIPDESGFFVANVDFENAGDWRVEAVLNQAGDETKVRPFSFPVREESQAPNIGDPAPPSDSPTLSKEPNIKRLSTDDEPELSFYEMTVAEALETQKPTVVVFATPAFCQTRFCGPILDNVKTIQPEFAKEANFIHIEPFVLDEDGQLVVSEAGGPAVAPTTTEWNLVSEPWIFVIDAEGLIAARFEGAASPDELRDALTAASA